MKKLFKFEFFSVCRVLVPIWCGTLLLSLLIGGLGILSAQLPALGESLPYLIIYTFAAILFIFAAMASIIASVVLGIQRFYKLLGNQGYLMFSLPMPAWKHIGARLLCACLTTTLAVAVFVVCGAVLSFSSIQAGALVTAENFQFLAFDDLADLLWSGYALLIWLLCLATIYLFLYLCMAIGAQWPQHRLAASIFTYFILTFVLQVLMMIAVIFVAVGAYSTVQSGDVALISGALTSEQTAAAHGLLGRLLTVPVGLSNILYSERFKESSKFFFRREPGKRAHR
ncbi:hypothetical protein [uncultured Subdoligranulum sp.]|uniref:hypothetical protein n=1 Tax=uncultured Subdoligranulum sp. TaxID=512298 RepID=UPI0025F08CDC|nr:hypothetical protein [uncultured Subdoligranulum sp.]